MRVVVVGGGISGLTAAWTVADRLPDAEVLLLEASDEVGGKLRVREVGGVRVDVGAEALLVKRPEGVDLLHEANLDDERIDPLTTSAGVFAGGRRHGLPAHTMMGIPGDLDAARESGLFTEAGLAAIAAEPSLPPLEPTTEDVSVGGLIRPRLGDEVADRLVEPLLGGVYAGRVDELSVRATMPALNAVLDEGGSIFEAAARSAAGGGTRSGSGPVFTSLRGGLGRLPQELATSGRFTVRTGVTARRLRRTAGGFELECGPVPEPELITADGVIVALPPSKASRLLGEVAPAASTALGEIDTASVAIVTLALRDVDLPPGSGLLVAAGERVVTKGLTISTQKWPIASDGLTLLRGSVGRAGDEVTLQRDDDELVELVRRELRPLLGVDAQPVDALVTRWGGGLPQYTVGHRDRIARARAAVAEVPGLAVCGAAYDGIGIPACIGVARQAAEAVAASLRAGGQ
ncbi:MAG: protoporphyrinogen oxidase [Jatrophihabitans sp.]|uniref:protoporphyrinogen oxidase n=1 Tax=Jatrophihabitans sp. TaxID=1932789 RepID=UPI003F822126